MEVYIDASSLEKEDGDVATLCLFFAAGEAPQTAVREAPRSRNELEAKYFALEEALESLAVRASPPPELRVFTDCWMLINQLQERYDVKDPGFLRHKRRVEDLLARFASAEVLYVPKAENPATVALVREVEARGSAAAWG